MKKILSKGISKNARLSVTRPRQNAHLPDVNSAFVAGASLDFDVFRNSPKILAHCLALLLVLSMLAACGVSGKRGGSSKSDKDDIELGVNFVKGLIDVSGGTREERDRAKEIVGSLTNNKWPADKLPSGMPAYPDGTPMTMVDGGTTAIVIRETSLDSLKRYVDMLKNNGWTFDDENPMAAQMNIYAAAREGWDVTLALTAGNVVAMGVTKKE
jgi:hypothetical protein